MLKRNQQRRVSPEDEKAVDADAEYNRQLTSIEQQMGSGITYDKDLTIKGKSLFGADFIGVFPRDKIPRMTSRQSCIFNLDTTGQPGSHWCAMYKQGSRTYVYDSYGRQVIGSGYSYTDPDAEQTNAEKNCGQRCLAWLKVVYSLGLKEALKI